MTSKALLSKSKISSVSQRLALSSGLLEEEEEEEDVPEAETVEWLTYLRKIDGHKPTPIEISITGSERYFCPALKWYNFDVYPYKCKLTNTGYTVLLSSKWRTERPYVEGGPFMDKHVLSQIHFHWGPSAMEGSDHSVDGVKHPAEMQVTFFRSEYITQKNALRHSNGVAVFCYVVRFGVKVDQRLNWVLEGFPRIQEAQKNTRVGPMPMSHLIPMFSEDYFMYWGSLQTVKGDSCPVRWIVPRNALSASEDQLKMFRKLWDPWDEPIVKNFRPLQPRLERNIFFINPHWCQYRTILPLPVVVPEPSISVLSNEYQTKTWMLPPQNAYMLEKTDEADDDQMHEEEDVPY